jgi:hypothetical protein
MTRGPTANAKTKIDSARLISASPMRRSWPMDESAGAIIDPDIKVTRLPREERRVIAHLRCAGQLSGFVGSPAPLNVTCDFSRWRPRCAERSKSLPGMGLSRCLLWLILVERSQEKCFPFPHPTVASNLPSRSYSLELMGRLGVYCLT